MSRTASRRLHRGIWYMGAKTRVIPGFLDRVLERELREGDTVVDLMSGSGVVSAFCADRYRVYATDVQLYSAVIAGSLIDHDPESKSEFLESLQPWRDLRAVYEENVGALRRGYGAALEREEELLAEFRENGGSDAWAKRYRRFLEDPAAVYPQRGGGATSSPFRGAAHLLGEEAMARRRESPAERPACLVTGYYANVYFGLRQAIDIDSLRIAIDVLGVRSRFAARKKTHYLSALLHTASTSTSGTSHFAQPRHLRKDSELRAMAKRRLLDIPSRFEAHCEHLSDTVRRIAHRPGNQACRADYRELIDARGRFRFPRGIDLVYLDPPYTADHYSRFYHVLEVLARYDYPELERDPRGAIVRGRYPSRSHRFQSDFSRRSRVEEEFLRVIRAASASGAKLVISYSWPSGLLFKRYAERSAHDCLKRFEGLCRRGYRRVRTMRRPMMHSGQGDSNLAIEELLVVCSQPS